MRLPVRYYGDSILRKKCVPIEKITDEIRQLIADMIETIDLENGIGLAAPQIGQPIRLFVLRNYVESADGLWSIDPTPRVYINPKLIDPSGPEAVEEEGCLSLPGLRAPVKRPWKITVEAIDINGNEFREEIEGYNARVRMHENDHINGVLFIDRLDQHIRNQIEPLLREMKKKYHP